MASFLKVMVLSWAFVLAWYELWLMMTYLINVWNLNFTHAAAIINVFMGLSAVAYLGMQFLVDAFMGYFWMLFLSSFASIIGFGFLSMSTPPVLSKATGTCSAYEPECIGEEQKILFYTALPLIAVGIFGHTTSLGVFMDKQIDEHENDPGITRSFVIGNLGNIIAILVAAMALPYVEPWSLRFGVPAICEVVAMIIFLSGSFSYKREKPEGSPVTTICRVFVASASKMFYKCPRNANQLYEVEELAFDLKPHTNGLSFLDKAAIILPTQTLEQQKKNRWRLCRVTEIEYTKIMVQIIPLFITSIICGAICSIGNTFFLEQANHMNRKIGKLKFPLSILLLFYEGARLYSPRLYLKVANKCGNSESRQNALPFGIAVSIILSTICCIVAALVETRRLNVVKNHGLQDKLHEKIPMNVFWLVPQYILLGSLIGIYENSFNVFLEKKLPLQMRRYMVYFNVGVIGIGVMGNVLLVEVLGKVTGRGGRLSWFQDTINKSRLDNYYWTLAVLSVVNLILYILGANGCNNCTIEIQIG